mgnify:FL=1
MKYYLIVGEASGDLHASHLMSSIISRDPEAQFRFFGGDMMSEAAGNRGVRLKHYRELAYMGFIPVLLHLNTILKNMRRCREDIVAWNPDVVILVDYPGFNLKVAKYIKEHTSIPLFYYISPKIWAWKEYRIKAIKRDISEMYSILPFEVPFYEGKHNYPIHYVGNPTADEVRQFRASYDGTLDIPNDNGLPVIALLAGSRLQEIKDNLPSMIEATRHLSDRYQMVLAGAPGVAPDYYDRFLHGTDVRIVYGKTYPLLSHAVAALVTSGTATLETALFGVPQVVCYRMILPQLVALLRRLLLKVKYISLVNLIADAEVVRELVADTFTVDNIRRELDAILPGSPARDVMLRGYEEVSRRLGTSVAPDNAAQLIVKALRDRK